MKMTIRKIAERAGVSRSAVDKVIHNRPGVREEVRLRVRQIMEETGYVPIHQALHAPACKTVAVIMPGRSNPYFAALQDGMDAMCAAMPGLTFTYYACETTDIAGMLAVLDFLDERPIDLYLIRGARSERLKARLNQLERPVVFLDSVVPGAKRPTRRNRRIRHRQQRRSRMNRQTHIAMYRCRLS